MNLGVDNLWVVNLFGQEIWITRTIFNTWIIMAVLILLAVIVRVSLRRFREVPTGFQNAAEAVVEIFERYIQNTLGDSLSYLGAWFFSAFAFILFSNLSGTFGLRPPTADWATTFAFAMATFFLIQFVGLRYRKGKYIQSFFEPNPIFFPLNLIGELARPVSLSFRLFGNVLAGTILMTLIYSLAPVVLRFVFPAALHAFFDVFSGALQTYIFCTLSLMFIKGASE